MERDRDLDLRLSELRLRLRDRALRRYDGGSGGLSGIKFPDSDVTSVVGARLKFPNLSRTGGPDDDEGNGAIGGIGGNLTSSYFERDPYDEVR